MCKGKKLQYILLCYDLRITLVTNVTSKLKEDLLPCSVILTFYYDQSVTVPSLFKIPHRHH